MLRGNGRISLQQRRCSLFGPWGAMLLSPRCGGSKRRRWGASSATTRGAVARHSQNGQWRGDETRQTGAHIDALRFPPTVTSCACVGLSGDGILSCSRSFTSRRDWPKVEAQSLAMCTSLQNAFPFLQEPTLGVIKAAQAELDPLFLNEGNVSKAAQALRTGGNDLFLQTFQPDGRKTVPFVTCDGSFWSGFVSWFSKKFEGRDGGWWVYPARRWM